MADSRLKVFDYVDQLKDLIEKAAKVPLSTRIVVDKQDVKQLLTHDLHGGIFSGPQLDLSGALVKAHAQSHSGKDIQLHQSLTAFVVCTQGGVPCPFVGKGGETRGAQARVGFCPRVLRVAVTPAFLPKFFIVDGKAVQ